MGWYHEMLCCKGADWLQNYKPWNHKTLTPGYDKNWGHILINPYLRLKERPDIFAFNGYVTLCIEVKTNYNDFKNDMNKVCRSDNYKNKIGMFKCYLAPKGIIPLSEVPKGWGLLEWDKCHDTIEVVIPCFKKTDPTGGDLLTIGALMDREKVEKGVYRCITSMQNSIPKKYRYEEVLKIEVGKINRAFLEKCYRKNQTNISMKDIVEEVQRRYMIPLS